VAANVGRFTERARAPAHSASVARRIAAAETSMEVAAFVLLGSIALWFAEELSERGR
jgi:hypothetical protein